MIRAWYKWEFSKHELPSLKSDRHLGTVLGLGTQTPRVAPGPTPGVGAASAQVLHA